MKRAAATVTVLATSVAASVVTSVARASGPLGGARADEVVVVPGAELGRFKRVHKDRLRAFAVREGAFAAIPFQVDERTPELDYCWTRGPEPLPKDVDDGLIDDDDEVVFRAGDAGPRASADVPAPRGAGARHVVEVEDPLTGERAQVTFFAFDKDPPERSRERYVEAALAPGGGARIVTRTFEVGSVGSAGTTGRPTHVRFRRDGRSGPVIVTDGARVRLHASYLFARIDREPGEARTSLGPALIDGPVRVVAPVAVELYLVWGNWISATRSYVTASGHTWEHVGRVHLPVDLQKDHPSEVRITVALPRDVEDCWFQNDRNSRRALDGSAALDRTFPAWNLLGTPEGVVLVSFALDPRVRNARGALAYAPPDASMGGEVGWVVDLTGLTRAADAYSFAYRLDLLPDASGPAARRLIEASGRPLKRLVR